MDVVDRLGLIIKFPERKPPFLGVVYPSSFVASRTNQSWVNTYGSLNFQLRFEPDYGLLKITLSQSELGEKYDYPITIFDEKKVRDFVLKAKNLKQINFGHVIEKEDEHIVVKTSVGNKLWVLKINKVEFFQEH